MIIKFGFTLFDEKFFRLKKFHLGKIFYNIKIHYPPVMKPKYLGIARDTAGM